MEVLGGGVTFIGGGAVTIGSGGTLAIGSVPAAVGGVALGTHGTAILVHNLQNPPFYFARRIGTNGDPTLSYGSNTGDTSENARILRRNMGVGDTPGLAAHHIVPSTNSYDAAMQSRGILQRLGIDINAKENGVLISQQLNSELNSHPYMDAVLSELQGATTKQQGIEILRCIGQRLLRNSFPY